MSAFPIDAESVSSAARIVSLPREGVEGGAAGTCVLHGGTCRRRAKTLACGSWHGRDGEKGFFSGKTGVAAVGDDFAEAAAPGWRGMRQSLRTAQESGVRRTEAHLGSRFNRVASKL
ncbi:hypothetical protein FHW84_002633 [Dyella sp. SG562]|uniref:hypothetical protein n=1 Tax=Dyella sp. SG562 TaxID=2587017 RepID=UPI001424214A|nr:hypothetical protein [Dyella sp. SG562]NII74048.1 hypothetical protein [Dyella sp. SG562]